jgi:uncharacterized membrane protein
VKDAALASIASALRALHIVGGVTALATFVVPLVVRKGNATHRLVGKIYVGGMLAASISSWLVAPIRLAQRPPERWQAPLFLAYVGLISFTAAMYGVRVLRMKSRSAPLPFGIDYVAPIALLIATPCIAVYGLAADFVLATAFAPIGLVVAIPQLRALRAAPASPRSWLLEHIGAMLISCIATITAFAVVNAVHFLPPGSTRAVAWFAPTLALTPLIVWWRRRAERGAVVIHPHA